MSLFKEICLEMDEAILEKSRQLARFFRKYTGLSNFFIAQMGAILALTQAIVLFSSYWRMSVVQKVFLLPFIALTILFFISEIVVLRLAEKKNEPFPFRWPMRLAWAGFTLVGVMLVLDIGLSGNLKYRDIVAALFPLGCLMVYCFGAIRTEQTRD